MSKSEEEQAAELRRTVWCRIGSSKVHGVGVIAIRDIKKGQRIFCNLKKPTRYRISFANLKKYLDFGEYKPIYDIILERWPNVVNEAPFVSPNDDALLKSFMNHSDDPNYSSFADVALKDIKAGEEVFENYRVMKNWEKVYPWLKDDKSKQ